MKLSELQKKKKRRQFGVGFEVQLYSRKLYSLNSVTKTLRYISYTKGERNLRSMVLL